MTAQSNDIRPEQHRQGKGVLVMQHSCQYFDPELPAPLLGEQCTVSVSIVNEPTKKALVTFTCPHGATRRHVVYPGTLDWGWLEASLLLIHKLAA
jgi:hypothetical protein